MSMTNKEIEAAFDVWWEKTGRLYDPDFEEVPWSDKRKGLAAKAYHDALCEAAKAAQLDSLVGREVKLPSSVARHEFGGEG